MEPRHSAYRADGRPGYDTQGTVRELAILTLLGRDDLLPSRFIYHELDNYEATRKRGITQEGRVGTFLKSPKGKLFKQAAIGAGVAGGAISGGEAILR